MKNLSRNFRLEDFKETSLTIILICMVFHIIARTFTYSFIFKYGIFYFIKQATSGLINDTLIINVLSALFILFLIIVKFGNLRLQDLGLKKQGILSGIFAFLMLSLLILISDFITGTKIFGYGYGYGYGYIVLWWNSNSLTSRIGEFVAQIFGNCLFEELFFRGFLLVQIWKKLQKFKGGFIYSLLLSQILFALVHIPGFIASGYSLSLSIICLTEVFINGLLLAYTYIVTRNIYLSIAIHLIMDMGAFIDIPLVQKNGFHSMGLIVLTIVFLMLWTKNFARFGENTLRR